MITIPKMPNSKASLVPENKLRIMGVYLGGFLSVIRYFRLTRRKGSDYQGDNEIYSRIMYLIDQLKVDQVVIGAFYVVNELIVSSGLLNSSIFDDVDFIYLFDSCQSMSYNQCCSALHQFIKCKLNLLFGFGIKRTCSFI